MTGVGVCGTAAGAAVACLVWPWARWQERRARRSGRPLDPPEAELARALGVARPERVCVLSLRRIPNPGRPLLRAARSLGLEVAVDPCGITLGYGILVTADAMSHALLAHELVHVAQHERDGGLFRFIRRYVAQCIVFGYRNAPYEQEARSLSGAAATGRNIRI